MRVAHPGLAEPAATGCAHTQRCIPRRCNRVLRQRLRQAGVTTSTTRLMTGLRPASAAVRLGLTRVPSGDALSSSRCEASRGARPRSTESQVSEAVVHREFIAGNAGREGAQPSVQTYAPSGALDLGTHQLLGILTRRSGPQRLRRAWSHLTLTCGQEFCRMRPLPRC